QSLRGELSLGLGDSLWMAGDVSGAKTAYEEVIALARRLGAGSGTGAGRLLARATLGYGHVLHAHELWVLAEPYLHLYEEALAALGEESIGLRARLLAGVAASHAYLGQTGEASRAADEAVALAERIGDRAALLDALEARVRARFGLRDGAARLADAAAIVRLAEIAGDRARELQGREHLLWSLLEQGDVAAADAEIETYARRAEASRLPMSRWTALKLRSIRAQMDGRFADAQRYADEALALAREAQIPLADLEHLWQSLFIQKASGQIPTWHDLPEQIVSIAVDQPGGIGRITLAAFYAEIGSRDQARQWFDSVAASDFAGVPRNVTRPFLLSLLAEVCAYLGDGPRAAVLYPLLLPYADTNVLMAVALTCIGAAGRYLGLLAATMEDWQAAERHFEDALAMNGRMSARSWLVRTQRDYAQTLLARGDAGDRPRAQRLLSAAGDTTRALGMTHLAEQIGSALRGGHIESDAEPAAASGAVVAGAPAHASGLDRLTPRETEVLRLLAAGLSNTRIAERLVVSRRTIEHHLTAIYAKLGAQGRVEAAAYALTHGLT
ncbi:MAG: LuxR C-terminal-related transcriptional regulator, partial [Dehalococcoidia bacterium]